MKTSKNALNEKIRNEVLTRLIDYFTNGETTEDILRTNSNEIAFPCVDEEGNEKFVVITVKVPTGSRDGEEYDGYAVAESYALKVKEKAEKAKKKEEK